MSILISQIMPFISQYINNAQGVLSLQLRHNQIRIQQVASYENSSYKNGA